MKGIVWLASYPKSGNTWFRAFLANYRRDGERPADINSLDEGPIASGRRSFDEAVGYDSGELSFDEVDALRPEVYRHLARTAADTPFCKVHDACTALPDGRPLFPPEATAAVLYFVRNPLDVCVSFAHHAGHAHYDRMIRQMGEADCAVCDTGGAEVAQLRQRLLSWSGHVRSWAGARGLRVLVLRYEDMHRHPEETFGAAVRFAGLPCETARLRKAIAFSRFEELRAQEARHGFDERSPWAQAFFRRGQIGAWREALTPAQVERLVADHGATMRRLGYLDVHGRPAD